MKKILILFVLTFSAVYGFGQTNIEPAKGKPILEIDTLIHDFGELHAGDSAVHYFIFKNVGTAPLVIDEIKTTCSCTASDWPKYPVPVGATASIRVEFDTVDKEPGWYAKGINMFSNAGETNMIINITIVEDEQ